MLVTSVLKLYKGSVLCSDSISLIIINHRNTEFRFEPEPAMLSMIDSPLSPHHEAKQKVKENMWEMSFTENGRYIIIQHLCLLCYFTYIVTFYLRSTCII